MKKLLAIALIAASFTACNSGEKKTEEKVGSDTTTAVVTNTDTVMKVTDTTVTTTTTPVDKSKMSADTTKTKETKETKKP